MTPDEYNEKMLDRREDEKLRRHIAAAEGKILIYARPTIEPVTFYIDSKEQPRTYGKQYRNSIHRGWKS